MSGCSDGHERRRMVLVEKKKKKLRCILDPIFPVPCIMPTN